MTHSRKSRRGVTATATAITATFLLTSCGPSPLPVHSEVIWVDGREPSGPFEKDPRVQAVREYVIEYGAARNALNYSGQRLNELATTWHLLGAAPSVHAIEAGDLMAAEGPSPFTVDQVIEQGEGEAWVEVCSQRAPWWTRDMKPYDKDRVSTSRDGDYYRHEALTFTPTTYVLVNHDGRWKVSSIGSSSADECDPGPDVAVALYTTPPDLSLLTEATPDMVFGPDGEPIG